MTSPLDHIPRLAAWLSASDLRTLELAGPAGRIRMSRGDVATGIRRTPAPLAMIEPPEPEAVGVRSPGVGTLLLAHPLHHRPLAGEGEDVAAGQPLALVRIGALLLPVPAPCDGILTIKHREEGALVGLGDRLFDIAPAD